MLVTEERKTNGPSSLQIQITNRRRGAGIILALFTILFLMGTGTARPAQAQTYIVLHNFAGGTNDGANPRAGMVRDSDGNLYGTTELGGSSSKGAVFVISTTPRGATRVIVIQVNGPLAEGVTHFGANMLSYNLFPPASVEWE